MKDIERRSTLESELSFGLLERLNLAEYAEESINFLSSCL
jgi:hypothetical protein